MHSVYGVNGDEGDMGGRGVGGRGGGKSMRRRGNPYAGGKGVGREELAEQVNDRCN